MSNNFYGDSLMDRIRLNRGMLFTQGSYMASGSGGGSSGPPKPPKAPTKPKKKPKK